MYAISPRRTELEFIAPDRLQRYPLIHGQVSAILPGYVHLETRAGVSYFSDNPRGELISSNIGIAQSRGEGGVYTGPSRGQFRCAREDGVPRDFRGERPDSAVPDLAFFTSPVVTANSVSPSTSVPKG